MRIVFAGLVSGLLGATASVVLALNLAEAVAVTPTSEGGLAVLLLVLPVAALCSVLVAFRFSIEPPSRFAAFGVGVGISIVNGLGASFLTWAASILGLLTNPPGTMKSPEMLGFLVLSFLAAGAGVLGAPALGLSTLVLRNTLLRWFPPAPDPQVDMRGVRAIV